MKLENSYQANQHNSPAFKAKFRVEGNYSQLKAIKKEFTTLVYGDKTLLKSGEKPTKLCKYNHIHIEDPKNNMDLFCTQDDTKDLEKYYKAQDRNLEKYVGVLDDIPKLNAKDVIQALKKGTFDLVNGVLKKD